MRLLNDVDEGKAIGKEVSFCACASTGIFMQHATVNRCCEILIPIIASNLL